MVELLLVVAQVVVVLVESVRMLQAIMEVQAELVLRQAHLLVALLQHN
jgi:hypothetical protein